MKLFIRMVGICLTVLALLLVGNAIWPTVGSHGNNTERVPATMPSSVTLPSTSTHVSVSCARTHSTFRPVVLEIERLRLKLPVLALPLVAGNTFPVPPGGPTDPRWSAAWWKDGAKPGSGSGTVHLDVHTYTDGSAVGNLLGNEAKPGDIIKVLDTHGRVGACYEVVRIVTWKRINVPTAELSRIDGSARLAIEFCWDTSENWGNHQWNERRYIIARAIT